MSVEFEIARASADGGSTVVGPPALRSVSPVALDDGADVLSALRILDRRSQAMGFVQCQDGLVGVVTIEDLRFAWDWAGPSATVFDAMTLTLVEIDRGADIAHATEAFSDGLRRWITARQKPSRHST